MEDDDASLDPASDDADIAFDDHLFAGTSHSECDERMVNSLQSAHDAIGRFTADEFISEAYITATQLRNVLGDSDGMAAELTETIRGNLMVVAQAISKDPTQFVFAALRAEPDPNRRQQMVTTLMTNLNELNNI